MNIALLVRPQAQALIKRFGTDVSIKRTTSSVLDPDTGTATVKTSNVTLKAIVTTVSRTSRDGLIQIGDMQFVFAAEANEILPQIGDELQFKGKAYRMIAPLLSHPGDEPVVHQAYARR